MGSFSVTVGVCAHRSVKISVWDTLWHLEKCPDPKINIKILDGDALISRSRCRVASYFLEKTNDPLLCFIDDDIKISTFDFTRLMWLAQAQNYPIIGAPYVTKSKTNPGFAFRPLNYGEKMMFGKNGMVYEVRSVSTGLIVIRREVLEKMISSGIAPYCRHGRLGYYPFFQHYHEEVEGTMEDLSEDWYFTEEARKLGYKVFLDSSIHTKHIGDYEYDWNDIYDTQQGIRKQYDSIEFTIGKEGEKILPERVGSQEQKDAKEMTHG